MIKYNNETIELPVEITFSRRKSISLSLDQDCTLQVKAPNRCPKHYIYDVLQNKQNWIGKQYQKQIVVREKKENRNLTPQQEAFLENQYRNAAKEYIPKRVNYFIVQTGGSYSRITIRGQKTCWGSCSSKGTLSFNWRLMLAPPRVLDYVVVHELTHLTHMNHSKEFWKAVEEIMPDYKIYRKWLKDHGSELIL